MTDKQKIYNCDICYKKYASYQSLWIHNKKYHKSSSSSTLNDENDDDDDNNNNNDSIRCKFCNKKFTRSDNCNRHYKICRIKIKKELELEKNQELEQTEVLTLKNKVVELESQLSEISELKTQVAELLKYAKIHPKTLQKINKNLINSNNSSSNNNINNNINSNNKTKTVINNTYVKFGYESITNLLSQDTIINNILKKPNFCIEESIKNIHFNKNLPEYNNIFITNMRDDIAYVFNGEQFISLRKNEVITDLITNYTEEIELYMEENKEILKNKLSEFNINRLKKFLELINDTEKKYNDNKTTYPNFKAYKFSDVKRTIYDNSDPKKLVLLNNIELKEKKIIYD
jgi:hypothetical protein